MPCFAAGSSGRRARRALSTFLLPLCLAAAPLTAQTDEIGVPSDGPTNSIAIHPLNFELAASYGYVVFTEDDMGDTYTGLPSFGLEASVGLSEEVRFILACRYGSTSGNPFYDTPGFTTGPDNELKVVPMLMGFRVDISEHPRFRVYFGLDFVASWIREEVPTSLGVESVVMEERSGLGLGVLMTLTPQWRSADDRYAIGVEIGAGGSSGEIGKGWDDHEVNLTGLSARLTISHRL
jgi:hypothetical protein